MLESKSNGNKNEDKAIKMTTHVCLLRNKMTISYIGGNVMEYP